MQDIPRRSTRMTVLSCEYASLNNKGLLRACASPGISVLSFPFARKPSPPAPSCQPQVALAPLGGSAARFGRSAEPLCWSCPPHSALAADTSPLDDFRGGDTMSRYHSSLCGVCHKPTINFAI